MLPTCITSNHLQEVNGFWNIIALFIYAHICIVVYSTLEHLSFMAKREATFRNDDDSSSLPRG